MYNLLVEFTVSVCLYIYSLTSVFFLHFTRLTFSSPYICFFFRAKILHFFRLGWFSLVILLFCSQSQAFFSIPLHINYCFRLHLTNFLFHFIVFFFFCLVCDLHDFCSFILFSGNIYDKAWTEHCLREKNATHAAMRAKHVLVRCVGSSKLGMRLAVGNRRSRLEAQFRLVEFDSCRDKYENLKNSRNSENLSNSANF